ncbi:sensor histidine kinase [Microbacterium galbinum]|uniref:histidine kinase n=1 Tax=Microbacterium galbinum TaxID=2851646 RepID=A0ABY4ITG2_9MICO|nr:ATP-binding protein [Microbacterium galbinum]MCK2029280.1 PAS domain-containing protein [Microbacterium galbinum]UPL14945.1 PAS domain-containing protein [Microbacterium galbinum]
MNRYESLGTAAAPAPVQRGWQRYFDDPTPLMKQGPTAIAVGVAGLLVIAVPGIQATNPAAAIVGIALVGLVTALAAVLAARGVHDGWIVLLIPAVDILAIGVLRVGTGGTASLFSSFVLLPVIWLAASPGLRPVFLIGVLTSIAFLMPIALDSAAGELAWLRGVISPLVFAVAGAIVNELSRLQRLRTAQAEALVVERTAALSANLSMVQQLQASEKQYQFLLESFSSLWSSITAQAVIATDRKGVVIAWNPGAERLIGLSVDEALDDVTVNRFFDPSALGLFADPATPRSLDDPTGMRALLDEVDEGRTVEADVDMTTAGGSSVPVRLTLSLYQGTDGAQRGYLLVITDETKAVEVARLKDEFVGMISHELRTPLSAIIGFLDLLQNDPEQPLTADQQDFVAVIERNAKRLLNLVGDLLFTAQAESGRFPLEKAETDLSALVRSAVESSGPNAQKNGVELLSDIPAEPIRLLVDAGRIGQAIDNLLSNAIKFTPSGGRVTARLEMREGEARICIEDTGFGIPEEEQGMLFTRFFRASTATRNAVPGVGLGLTITRAIVQAHGGTMSMSSEVGKGTEFWFTLPVELRTEALRLEGLRNV